MSTGLSDSGLQFEALGQIAGSRPDGFVYWHMPNKNLAVVIVYGNKGEIIDITWNSSGMKKAKSIFDE